MNTVGGMVEGSGAAADREDPIRVVIIDDHVMFVQGLQLLLESTGRGAFQVVGISDQASEAEELVRRHRPHLAIVDLAMAPPGGVGAIRVIKRRYPQVKVLALSGTDNANLAIDALVAGASGFLPKSADPAVMLAPIRSMIDGWTIMPPPLLQHLLSRAARPKAGLLDNMSEDERVVWQMLAAGAETAEVAERFVVSERTAKRMVATVLRKIGATNRPQAAVLAFEAGLLDQTP